MGNGEDYKKGYKSGYGIGRPGIPTNFGQMVGHNEGKAQRERELAARSTGNAGANVSSGVGTRGVLLLLAGAGILTLGVLLIVLGPTLIKLLFPLVAIVGLVKTKSLKRHLGPATPIYIGALVGMLLGCIELAITSSQLRLSNLMIFIFAGAFIGSFGVPIVLAREKKKA